MAGRTVFIGERTVGIGAIKLINSSKVLRILNILIGAVSVMHSHVVQNLLGAFNREASRRNPKWKDARNTDELGRINEREFLEIFEALGLIGKNVKRTLQDQCLNLRNACGHPSSLRISENMAAAHLDALVLNVYSRF